MSIQIKEDVFDILPETTQEIRRFTISNTAGMSVQLINYGATITSIRVPDKNNQIDDVVWGFDDIQGYLGAYGRNPYFGATIGRVANRIAKGKFCLNGKEYTLATNNGENHLHGGVSGFDKKMWSAEVLENGVKFSYVSKDGEEGYPGELKVCVTHTLTDENQLMIDYSAETSEATPVNLTNHSYFNLSGHQFGDTKLVNHFIEINADKYTPVDSNLIPTGELKDVDGTLYDLRTMKDLHSLLVQFPPGPNGYDTNFCVNSSLNNFGLRLVARVECKKSGRMLTVHANQPGVQFYTSNFLPGENQDPLPGKQGAKYTKHGAFCLETQNYPNAINMPAFPNPVLQPGSVYEHKTIFQFSNAVN